MTTPEQQVEPGYPHSDLEFPDGLEWFDTTNSSLVDKQLTKRGVFRRLLSNAWNAAVHRHVDNEQVVLQYYTPDAETRRQMTTQDLLAIDQILEEQGAKPSDGYVLYNVED